MSFNWRDYLNVAKELIGIRVPRYSQEAKARSAVSRAYYAAFIEARNFLRDKEGKVASRNEHPHGFVIDTFLHDPNPIRSRIGADLQKLRGLRNLADYEDVFFTPIPRAREAVRVADNIFKTLDRL